MIPEHMHEYVEKANVLIEALPYIQAFHKQSIVIKFGGSAMEEKKIYDSILTDVAFLSCVGLRPVIVHGGGKAITRRMMQEGLKPAFVQGLRVTDEQSIRLIEKVLQDEINPQIVQALIARGARARGIHGTTIMLAEKHMPVDDATNKPIDVGFVGRITDHDAEPIKASLESDEIPVITPLARDKNGKIYNINADDAGAAIALSIQTRKLVFLSDVPGLLRDPNDPNSIISTLKQKEVETLIKGGVIAGGMLPKIQSALGALSAGVKKVHIIDGRLPHSLLLEIFTDKGIGTEIIQND